MNEQQLQSPQHASVRLFLRVSGPVIAGVGLMLVIIGMVSFFSHFGTFDFEPPRYFWCAFVGLPLLFFGFVVCHFGYMGSILRYMMGETAPVAKDAANYLGENIQPGVKAVAQAVTEGIIEAQRGSHP
jgi:hypothetical protein